MILLVGSGVCVLKGIEVVYGGCVCSRTYIFRRAAWGMLHGQQCLCRTEGPEGQRWYILMRAGGCYSWQQC